MECSQTSILILNVCTFGNTCTFKNTLHKGYIFLVPKKTDNLGQEWVHIQLCNLEGGVGGGGVREEKTPTV